MNDQELPKSPREAYQQGYNEGRKEAEKTLRDEIAMRAMQVYVHIYELENLKPDGMTVGDDDLARRSYQSADAMLKARQGDE